MPYRLRLLGRFRHEVELDLDLELAPSCFGHFEGWGFDGAEGVGVGFVQLELHFAEPVGDVLAVDATDIDGPSVGVVGVEVGRSVSGVEGSSYATKDWGTV